MGNLIRQFKDSLLIDYQKEPTRKDEENIKDELRQLEALKRFKENRIQTKEDRLKLKKSTQNCIPKFLTKNVLSARMTTEANTVARRQSLNLDGHATVRGYGQVRK